MIRRIADATDNFAHGAKIWSVYLTSKSKKWARVSGNRRIIIIIDARRGNHGQAIWPRCNGGTHIALETLNIVIISETDTRNGNTFTWLMSRGGIHRLTHHLKCLPKSASGVDAFAIWKKSYSFDAHIIREAHASRAASLAMNILPSIYLNIGEGRIISSLLQRLYYLFFTPHLAYRKSKSKVCLRQNIRNYCMSTPSNEMISVPENIKRPSSCQSFIEATPSVYCFRHNDHHAPNKGIDTHPYK